MILADNPVVFQRRKVLKKGKEYNIAYYDDKHRK